MSRRAPDRFRRISPSGCPVPPPIVPQSVSLVAVSIPPPRHKTFTTRHLPLSEKSAKRMLNFSMGVDVLHAGCRESTPRGGDMANRYQNRIELLQGTLDLLVLQ